MPILYYSNEIRSAVMVLHGDKAHSCYFSKDAYAAMTDGNKYQVNKELLRVPEASHTDLYDRTDIIPFDKFLLDYMAVMEFFRNAADTAVSKIPKTYHRLRLSMIQKVILISCHDQIFRLITHAGIAMSSYDNCRI